MGRTRGPQALQDPEGPCPLTDRPHLLQAVPDSLLRQCETCQDLFPPPEGLGSPRNDEAPPQGSSPVGEVNVDPGANTATIALSPEGLRALANDVIQEMAKTQLGTDLPHIIALTMVGVAYLKAMGMGHNEIMQVVSIAFNGDVTGLFSLDLGAGPDAGETPDE